MNYDNAIDAMSAAYIRAPIAIGYRNGAGWELYDPTTGAPKGVVPEFLCLKQGKTPIPLSEVAVDVLFSIISEVTQ